MITMKNMLSISKVTGKIIMPPTTNTTKNSNHNTEVLLLISTENMRKIRKTLEIAMLIMKTTKIKSKSRTRKITTRTKDQF